MPARNETCDELARPIGSGAGGEARTTNEVEQREVDVAVEGDHILVGQAGHVRRLGHELELREKVLLDEAHTSVDHVSNARSYGPCCPPNHCCGGPTSNP